MQAACHNKANVITYGVRNKNLYLTNISHDPKALEMTGLELMAPFTSPS